MLKGIDISHYQGQPSFDALKAAVDFVIVKATEGCPDPGQTVVAYEDSQFQRNQSEVRRVGMLHGFYHFARPDYNDPAPEAEEYVNAINGFQNGEVTCLDFETYVEHGVSSSDPERKQKLVAWALSWLNRFEELTGNKALIYLNESTVNSYDWSPVYNAGHGLWVAKYGANDGTVNSVNTGIWPTAAFYQFCSTGAIAGMKPVDVDNFYGDADAFRKYGYQAPTPPPPPVPTPDPLQAQLDAANATIADLQGKLDTANANVQFAQNSNAQLNQQLAAEQAKEATMVAQIDDLNKTISMLRTQTSPEATDLLSLVLRFIHKIIR